MSKFDRQVARNMKNRQIQEESAGKVREKREEAKAKQAKEDKKRDKKRVKMLMALYFGLTAIGFMIMILYQSSMPWWAQLLLLVVLLVGMNFGMNNLKTLREINQEEDARAKKAALQTAGKRKR